MDQRFLPGPMISDVEPHLLKENEWQEVINCRMNKFGSLSNVERFHESIGGTAFKAVEEFTEDNSGSRFLLIQDGTSLYRVDYHAGDGDGYENEALGSALTMPADVTIPSDVTCKFFFFRGVIRIVGPIKTTAGVVTDCPLWYGYIKRTILEDAWELKYEGDFETDVEGWTSGTGAAVTQVTSATVAKGSDCLQIDEDGSNNANGYKLLTVANATKTRVRLHVRRSDATPGDQGDVLVKIGKTLGGYEYDVVKLSYKTTTDGALTGTVVKVHNIAPFNIGMNITIGGVYTYITDVDPVTFEITVFDSVTVADNEEVWGDWAYLESDEFTTTGTSLYISIIPSENDSDGVCLVDLVQVFQQASISFDGWYLKPANLVPISIRRFWSANWWEMSSGFGAALANAMYFFPRISNLYDRAQYTLLNNPDYTSWGGDIDPGDGFWTSMNDGGIAETIGQRMTLQLPGADLSNPAKWPDTSNPNARSTGFMFVNASEVVGTTKKENELTFYEKEYVDFLDKITNYKYARTANHEKFYYDSTHPKRLYLNHDVADITLFGDNYLLMGRKISFSGLAGDLGSAIITAVGIDTSYFYIELSVPIASIPFDVSLGSGYLESIVEVERFHEYNAATGYFFTVVFDPTTLANEFYAISQIPAGTKSLDCGSSHMAFVGERSWLVSTEDEQADQLRYSPVYQPDSHPDILVAPNKSGDADSNKVVLNIGDRIVCLKENTITQVQYSNGGFYLDIGLEHRGLFPIKGFIVIDGVLIFMDKDDAYSFQSGSPVPVISKANLRKYYLAHVSASSFITFDRINKEVWFVLDSTHILVWQMEYNNWFVREIAYTLLGGFTDYDGDMIVFTATKTYSKGSAGTDDESMRLYLKGRELGRSNLHKFKKILRSIVDGVSNAVWSTAGPYLKLISDGVVDHESKLDLQDYATVTEDFETGTGSFTGVNATISNEAEAGVNGRNCLKIQSTVNGGYASRAFTGVVGGKFQIQFSVRSNTTPTPATFKIRIGNGTDDDLYGEFTVGAIGGWDLIEVRAPLSSTSLYVVVKVIPLTAGQGIAYVDYIQFRMEERALGYIEVDTPVMFHILHPEISTIPSTSRTLTFKNLLIKQKDWNLNA